MKVKLLSGIVFAVTVAACGESELRTSVTNLAGQARQLGCSGEELDIACPGLLSPLRLLDRVFLGDAREARCVAVSARCLETLGPAATPALPELLEVLADGPNNYDTGDGIIAARSAVASALAAVGDARVIGPLAEALRNAEPAVRGPGALPSLEPAARTALLRALASFGPRAHAHASLIADVLRERNADADARIESRRQAFEYSHATRLAAQALTASNPGKSSFTIPHEEIERQRAALDPAARSYLRAFESYARDVVASAAARALGQMQALEEIPLLITSLANPGVAEAAAKALEQLLPEAGAAAEAGAALLELVASPRYGPAAKRAGLIALGAVPNPAATTPLIDFLDDPELATAAARSLGRYGALARPALPRLTAVVRMPPPLALEGEAEAEDDPIVVTRRRGLRIAAVRAIVAIAPEDAARYLGPLAGDPDIGRVIRKALKTAGARDH